MIDAGIGANSASDTRYGIDNSLKLNSANSEYLYETRDASGSDWNRLLWTASMWVKHMPTESSATSPKERMFGAADANNDFDIRFRGQPIGFRNNSDVDGVAELRTTAVYRDYNAWMHIVAVWDTANSTAGNRMRLYVNGEEVTGFSTDTQPSQNEKSVWGKKNDGTDGNVTHTIGAYYNSSSGFAQGFNGYMAEVHWVEGQALAPSDFGEFDTGIWIPKEYTGSYGTNGFYLKFEDSSNLGLDSSGNSHNWSLSNLTAADQATDTPTNNFATLNQLHYTTKYTITEGGTNQVSSVNGWGTSVGSIGVTSGKWYFEIKTPDNNGYTTFGAIDADSILSQYLNGDAHAGDTPYGISYYGGNGGIIVNGSYISGTSFSSYNTQIMGCALDLDNNKIYFSKSGTYGNSGNPVTGANGISLPSGGSGTWFFSTSTYVQPLATNQGGYTTFSISSAESDENGYGTFEYAPPTGYYALCTKNLAEYG